MSAWEEVYTVGQEVEIEMDDEWVTGKVVLVQEGDISLPYLVKIEEVLVSTEVDTLLWTKQGLASMFSGTPGIVDISDGLYLWPYPFEIRSSFSKYNLERTTFLEGIEL